MPDTALGTKGISCDLTPTLLCSTWQKGQTNQKSPLSSWCLQGGIASSSIDSTAGTSAKRQCSCELAHTYPAKTVTSICSCLTWWATSTSSRNTSDYCSAVPEKNIKALKTFFYHWQEHELGTSYYVLSPTPLTWLFQDLLEARQAQRSKQWRITSEGNSEPWVTVY